MMRRILSVMLAVSLVFPWSRAFVVTAMAEELPPDTFVIASGDCGDDLTWELQENGTLIITGTGAMDVYSYTWDNSLNKEVTTAPWGEYLDHIERISLPYGLTSIGPCAFSGLNITEIAIPDSVVYIGWGAFYYTNLSGELVIPESVTSIDVAAFANTGISGELVIPDSITYIYAKAFKNTDITGLVLPDTLQGIELEAFNSCTNLTGTLVIPESVTEIGDYAFAYTGISSVSMPDPWPYLGEGVFRGCPNLTEDYSPKRGACGDNLTWELQSDGTLLISGTGEMRSYRTVLDESAGKDITAAPWGEYWESIERISLPEGLTSIGGCAFYGLNITEISIPDTVTHICWHSFATCVNLSGELLIPESVTNIDAYAFAYTGISSARIPSPWTHLAEGVFYGCPNLTEDNFRSCGDSLTWELQGEGTLVITGTGKMWSFGHTWDESAHKWVTSAPWGQYWESIDSISLPEGLKSIGDLAFEGMNITEITIPSTVTYIGIAAFYGCVDLSGELVIPESVTRIRDYAFAHTGISSVDMPEPRPELGQGVFRGCSDLTENYAPKSGICGDNLTWELQEDGTLLFSGTGEMFSYTFDWNERENKGITAASWGDHWQSIERIVLPDGLTSIGDCAFTGLNITEIAIPNTVSFIGNYAFNECEDLCGTLVIPRSVTSIGSCAFGITGITKVYLPEPRPTLGEEAFPKGVTYAVLGAAVITADAILYLEPARNEKQNGSIEEGTEVVVVATTGVFSQLSDGSWIESKYVYEFSTPYPATADKLGQGTTVAKISYYEYPS
ncbi:MAG: leucine-rich repeat protein, partial [Lachnospiraceae bacterium]|nr:leucine-rich repeat protein [Lachnospiraceae bacterium]